MFQGFRVCGHGVVVLRGGSGCAGRWGIFEGENGSFVFPEGGRQIETGVLCRLFCCPGYNTVLLDKVLYGVGPVSIASFLPLLHHQVFEDIGLEYARDKLRDFVVVGDIDVLILGVVLSPCKVSSVGAEMLVGGVATVGNIGSLRHHSFGIGYYRPRAEVSDERQNGFHTVPEVVHLFFFNVLWHDGGKNSGFSVENDGFLDMVLVPCHLMLVVELLVLGDGCQGSDVGVRERRFSILLQLSMGSLATWRISVSSRTKDRQPCSPPQILVLRLVATCAIAFTSSFIDRVVGIVLSRGNTAALKHFFH